MSNECLVFVRARVYPVDKVEGHKRSVGESKTLQFDGGAGHTVIEPGFAKAHGYILHVRAVPGAVVGFNGSSSKISHYVRVGVEVEGRDVKGCLVKRNFITQALVTP